MAEEKSVLLGPPLGGVRNDLPTVLIPPQCATKLYNVNISDKALTKRPGNTQLGSTCLNSAIVGFKQFTSYSNVMKTVTFTLDNIYKMNVDKTWTSIKDASSWQPTITQGVKTTFFMNTLIFTNFVDAIRKWNGVAATTELLTGAAAYKASDVETFRERVILLNTIESGISCPQRMRFTVPGTLDDFTNPGSGFNDLLDTPGFIQNGTKLGLDLIIYKTDSIVVCSYLGGKSTFSLDTRVINKGLVAHRAVVDMGSYHMFLAYDNIYKFDGSRTPVPMGEPIKDVCFKSIRADYIERAFARKFGHQAWFFIPINSEYADTVFIYDEYTNNWTYGGITATYGSYYYENTDLTIGDLVGNIGDLAGSIGSFASVGITPSVCIGDAEGNLYSYSDLYSSDNGVAIAGMWESGDLMIYKEQTAVWCRYRGIYIDAKGDSVDVEYSLDEGATWVDLGTVTLGSKYQWITVGLDDSNDKIRIRFSNSTVNSNFYIRQIKLGYREDLIRC